MTSIKPGDRYVYKTLGYHATVTEVRDHSIWLAFDFGDGKCGLLVNTERIEHVLTKCTLPEE